MREREPTSSITMRGEFDDRELAGIADVDRARTSSGACHQPDEAVDQIIDIAERAGLQAVAVDGDVARRAAPGR